MSAANSSWLVEAFELARDDFMRNVKHPDRFDFKRLVTADDVWKATEEIQMKQAQTKTLRGLHRIRPFLEALTQFATTIEVFVQVKPEILALIWGPLKFILQISSALSSAFDKVVKVLGDIGDVLPLFQKYHLIFQENHNLKRILSMFYADILEFYKILVNFMHDRRWKTFLEPLWPSVRSKLSVVEDSIKRHKILLTDHATLEHILQSDQSRKRAIQQFETDQDRQNRQEFDAARSEFSQGLHEETLDDILCESSVDSGAWLEKHGDYTKWFDMKDSSCRVLWLQGIPGSGESSHVFIIFRELQLTEDQGKTFLAANITRRLQKILPGKVLFVFLANANQKNGRVREVLHSILFQAATGDETLKSILLGEIRCNSTQLKTDTAYVKKLVATLLGSCGLTRIVVDGLDEIEEKSRQNLLETLLELLDASNHTKLLISSRAERDIEKMLHNKAVSLKVDHHNQEDIQSYADLECKKWITELENHPADEVKNMVDAAHQGVKAVLGKSRGMFLYTKLVLQLLKDQGTAEDIQDELRSLPEGLDQAYGRILTRISTKLSSTQKTIARKVLQWLSCGLRPLREEEILQILVIDSSATHFSKGKRFNTDIRMICGPIIEVVDGTVRFVHFSAKEYIAVKGVQFLELEKAALDAAVTCSAYLCHDSLNTLFDARSTPEDIRQNILNRNFVFFDYAANMWLQHVSLVETGVAFEGSGLNDILSKLVETRDLNTPEKLNPPYSMLERFKAFRDKVKVQKALAHSYSVQGKLLYGELSGDAHIDAVSNSIAFRLFEAVQSFRTHLENMYCPEAEHKDGCHCPDTLRIYGPPTFFCEKPFCDRYRAGFPTRSARETHMATHQRNYRCPQPDCFRFEHGFHTQAALDKHRRMTHAQDEINPNDKNTRALSSTALGDLDDYDLLLVLEDLIIHSKLDTIRTLFVSRPNLAEKMTHTFNLRNSSSNRPYTKSEFGFDYCVCLSAWKSTPDVLCFFLHENEGNSNPDSLREERRLLSALATAIEAKNRPNIKYLFSFGPSLTYDVYLPAHFENIILNKRRQRIRGPHLFLVAADIASRLLGLWDSDLIGFLKEECQFVIPSTLASEGLLFSRPAIENLDFEEVKYRFESVCKYITDACDFDEAIRHAVASKSVPAVKLCLENHGNPDTRFRSTSKKEGSWNLIGFDFSSADRVGLEIMRLLLQHGANPVPLDGKGQVLKGYHDRFRAARGVSWDEFVQKSRLGEELEMILPKKHRTKVD